MKAWPQWLKNAIGAVRGTSNLPRASRGCDSDDDLVDRLLPKIADRLLQAAHNEAADDDEFIQRLLQRMATTPTLFGGGWERVSLGHQVKLVNALLNVTSGRIVIGDCTFLGHNVSLLTGSHNMTHSMQNRQAYPESGRDIVIGKGVWIASNAIVLGPCVVGDNAVIAAGAVVVGGTLESGCIYAGVPARKIRDIDF